MTNKATTQHPSAQHAARQQCSGHWEHGETAACGPLAVAPGTGSPCEALAEQGVPVPTCPVLQSAFPSISNLRHFRPFFPPCLAPRSGDHAVGLRTPRLESRPWRFPSAPSAKSADQAVALPLPNPGPIAALAALCRESAALLPPAATANSVSQGISKGSWTKSPHAIAAFSKITKSGRKRQSHQASGLSFPARFWPSRVIAHDLPPDSSGGEAFVSSCLRSLPRAVARGALRVEMARVPAISDLFRLLPTPFRSVADPIFPHSPLPVPHSPKSARLFAENHENAFFGNFRQLRRTFRGARSRPQCCVLHPPLARFGAAEPCGTWPRWRPQPFRLSTLHSLGGAADHIAALAAIGNPIGTPQTALPAPPAHLPAESRRGIADSAFFTKIGTFRRPIPIGAL